jgi:hypothetical protein
MEQEDQDSRSTADVPLPALQHLAVREISRLADCRQSFVRSGQTGVSHQSQHMWQSDGFLPYGTQVGGAAVPARGERIPWSGAWKTRLFASWRRTREGDGYAMGLR